MPNFFIHRPKFAWVIAIFIALAGMLAISSLPVSQYPDVAPPQILITATYAGASAEVINDSVTSVIEEELDGANGLLYYESQSSSAGIAEIYVTFAPGTDPDLAQMDVQNRIKRVESRLPASVTREGLLVEQANSNFLMMYALTSDTRDEVELSDYAVRNVNKEIRRVPGVGRIQMFAAERALRIWVDPAKLVGFGLSITDVNQAIEAQNVQVSSGSIGEQPSPTEQEITAIISVQGQLTSIDEFSRIVLRANQDGSTVRLGDVARIEMGQQDYRMSARRNGQPAAAVAVQTTPGANALQTATGVKQRLAELSAGFPDDIEYSISFDTSTFAENSIKQVLVTLAQAIALVFLVMLVFLQNIRYTFIPTVVVPVCLLGTLAVLLPLGFSINMMTMFGMVLAVGILVDDATIVVENVERIMAEEGLAPKEATIKAMKQITGAIVGTTLALSAVFVPLAFMDGSAGVIYRQFSVTLAVSVLLSTFLALTFTPALCATILKPVPKGGTTEKKGFAGWFNRGFGRLSSGYTSTTTRLVSRNGRMMVVYGAIIGVLVLSYTRLPTAFLPTEDQGYLMTDIQLAPGATYHRTLETTKQMEDYFLARPDVAEVMSVQGFSFSGSAQNAGLAFVTLKDWSDRTEGTTAMSEADRSNEVFAGYDDGLLYSVVPPPVEGLGNSSGFSLRLQDRGALGREALLAATDELMAMVSDSSSIAYLMIEGLADAPELDLRIDRDKAEALGVSFDVINASLSTAFGSAMINEFPNQGRMQRVVVQAEPSSRATPESLRELYVPNRNGALVPFESFVEVSWQQGPVQVVRYNGYPSIKLYGDVLSGSSTGEAMDEIEGYIAKLGNGIGYEWTGLSYQEKAAGAQTSVLLGLAILVVFLVLVALYESWKLPFAILLIAPIGALGAVLAVSALGIPNDIYFKVGLITIIGLATKNAILIISFAKDLHAQGKTLAESAIEASRLRFRAILMTTLTFLFAVIPLVIASGAGATSQRAVGTGVFGGMVSATALGLLFVPVFFVWVMSFSKRKDEECTPEVQVSALEGNQ
ncbi:multidrug efflux RND transporter permease subunit [Vibrio metschnikovii]|uniref:multidrug efflux RND transporter permease subunit n=1 Tax=Vibrio metschnikovii TaxID=28172 RepID=UPI001C30C6F6|nr:multidrug efflux RND transporter permease subunit [Vibrio metschnikovii]